MIPSCSSDRSSKTILLAGIGGDAHSVGLNLLRRALMRAGFHVMYLGTQNSIAAIAEQSGSADAVLISNMDGHCRHYVAELGQPTLGGGRPWYVGGNPSTDLAADRGYLQQMGFSRIFSGYVSPQVVVNYLDEDLGTDAVSSSPDAVHEDFTNRWGLRPRVASFPREISRSFLQQRDEVLGAWATGDSARDIQRNAERLRATPSLADAQERAQRKNRVLLHPRCGVGSLEGQRLLFSTLQMAGADVLSFQVDSLTRNNLYSHAQTAIDGAKDSGRGNLNGFPAVNHGADAMFDLVRSHPGVPFQVRHSTRDPRLLAEISFAGGVSGFEGGPICYNLPYFRDYDPEEAVHAWRYVDLLAGHYQQVHGVRVDREFFGTLTAALVPPCIAIASCILEALMAADAGVRSLSLGYAEQGNRAQDIAAVRVMGKLGREFLVQFGHADAQIATVFHQYMCAFPRDAALATELLLGSTETAIVSGATRMMLKTRVEATEIPSAGENAYCLRLMQKHVADCVETRVAYSKNAVLFESRLIEQEVRAILHAALSAAEGNVHRATVLAIARGLLDVPFSPSVWNAGKALTMRDTVGAVRFVEFGNIPLPEDVREVHRNLVQRRLERYGTSDIEGLIAEDIVAVTDGRIDGWPLKSAPRGATVGSACLARAEADGLSGQTQGRSKPAANIPQTSPAPAARRTGSSAADH